MFFVGTSPPKNGSPPNKSISGKPNSPERGGQAFLWANDRARGIGGKGVARYHHWDGDRERKDYKNRNRNSPELMLIAAKGNQSPTGIGDNSNG